LTAPRAFKSSAILVPVHLVYPYGRFYAARLRSFVEVMRKSVPLVVGRKSRR